MVIPRAFSGTCRRPRVVVGSQARRRADRPGRLRDCWRAMAEDAGRLAVQDAEIRRIEAAETVLMWAIIEG